MLGLCKQRENMDGIGGYGLSVEKGAKLQLIAIHERISLVLSVVA